MNFELIEKRYQNLDLLFTKPNALSSHLYSDPSGYRIMESIKKIFKEIPDLYNEVYSDLRTPFNVALSYSRALICSSPNLFWNQHLLELNEAFSQFENQLNSDEKNCFQEAILEISTHAVHNSTERSDKFLNFVTGIPGKVLILPETVRLGRYLRDFIDQNGFESQVKVILDKSQISKLVMDTYDTLLFPAAPNKFMQRKNYDIYLRTLLFSGCAPSANFLSPDWSFYREDLLFPEKLFESLAPRVLPKMVVLKEATNFEILPEDEVKIEETIDSFDSVKVDVFEQLGPISCKLVHLVDDLIYPVEEDAVGISVLVKSTSGQWELSRKHPFDEDLSKDLLVACLDSSEIEPLRERAAKEMSKRYAKYEASQEKWKYALEQLRSKLSENDFFELLLKNGVSKVLRTTYWTLPTSVQPNLKSDFIGALRAIGFDDNSIKETVALADEYLTHLRNAGRQAGRAIVDAMEEDDLTRIENGYSVRLILSEFGDAEYLISPIQRVGIDEVKCRAGEIRRIMRSPRIGTSV